MSTYSLTEPSITHIAPNSSGHLLDKARALRQFIEAEADAAEKNGALPLSIVDAMRDTGLFWILCPRELGGAGESVRTYMSVVEEVSCADGSAGWTLQANSTGTIMAALYCSDENVAHMFGGSRMPIMALSIAPTGRAVEQDGAFKGGGRFGFGTGVAHADWVGGAMVLYDGDKPRLHANGKPVVIEALVPRSEVELRGNWNVTGMQGTGSFDFEISERIWPAAWTFNHFVDAPIRGGTVARMGNYALACAGHVGVVLGIAKRALEELARIALTRRRLGSNETIAAGAVFRSEFMQQEALLRAARALVFEVFADAEKTAEAGKQLSPLELARIRQAVTWTHKVAREVAQYSFSAAGSSSIRKPSAIDRCVRDVMVAGQHILVEPMTLVEAAPIVIDDWAASRAG